MSSESITSDICDDESPRPLLHFLVQTREIIWKNRPNERYKGPIDVVIDEITEQLDKKLAANNRSDTSEPANP